MKTERAEKEIKALHDSGLNFDYDISDNTINKLMITIERDHNMKDIVSKLKEGEKLLFYLNDGKKWNGKQGDECKMFYHKKRDGSIYWKHDTCGECVRIDSDKGSIQEWGRELDKIFITP